MTDHRAVLDRLEPQARAALLERSDARGLRHLALHLGAIGLCSAGIMAAVPLWPFLICVQGVLLVFLFTLSHEATHQTPFKSVWINEAVGHAIAPVLCLPFIWFRYFHLAHHKYTNDPQRDPEIAGHPRPSDWRSYLLYLSGFGYWAGMLRTLWTNAFERIEAPYLPERKHTKIQREAQIILGIYTMALFSLIWTPLAFWLWLLPVVIGQPVLRAYLLAEHGLCPPVANMLENTRTTLTNRLVRALAWNMPYHIEHHSAPNVPFHKLPALHAHMKGDLVSVSDGYRQFQRDYQSSLLR